VLVVWKLDRLGRSLSFLIELIDKLRKDQAGFESLSDGINTTTAGGKLVFHIMGALAEFERALILERSKAGMQAARK
jgi:DNA invertase Pin-like site-specific DNA recombinase